MPYIQLTKDQRVRVDLADFERLNQYSWCAIPTSCGGWCAARRGKGKFRRQLIRMHRQILGLLPGDGRQVDHANHNTLDNRLCNLRICTQVENMRNRQKRLIGASSFKGVSRNGSGWRARIRVRGQECYLGTFATEIEAARAYDEEVRTIFGKFACFNFPRKGEQGIK